MQVDAKFFEAFYQILKPAAKLPHLPADLTVTASLNAGNYLFRFPKQQKQKHDYSDRENLPERRYFEVDFYLFTGKLVSSFAVQVDGDGMEVFDCNGQSYLLIDYPRSRIDYCYGRIAKPNGQIIYKIYRNRGGYSITIKDCNTNQMICTIYRKQRALYKFGAIIGLLNGIHRYYFTDNNEKLIAKSAMHLSERGIQIKLKIYEEITLAKSQALLGTMLFFIIDEIHKKLGSLIKEALVYYD